MSNHTFFFFTINYVGFCQRTNRQRANHTISEERGGDYRAMASSQGILNDGEERERGWVLIGGWCGSESDGMFHQQLSMSAHAPIPRPWGTVTCVYHSRCALASSVSLIVLECLAKCGHCVRHWESGMALGMMPLQSSHLSHAWMYTTLCVISHHVSFLLLDGCWNSLPSRNGCCVCGVNAIHSESVCLWNDWPQWFHESALKGHFIHCHSLVTLAPVCLLCSERDLVCNTPCMVVSVVTRHWCDCYPCHFAHTRYNVCCLQAMEQLLLFTIKFVGFYQSAEWQHANHTTSKRDVGLSRYDHKSGRVEWGLKERWRDEGFDCWMVWKWVWWGVSSTVVNVSPFTHPSSLRDSHIFTINLRASVSVPTDSVPTTQSLKREVWSIALWPQARVCNSHAWCCFVAPLPFLIMPFPFFSNKYLFHYQLPSKLFEGNVCVEGFGSGNDLRSLLWENNGEE